MVTVLLVEDEAAVRNVLRHMLVRSDFAVLEAGGAADALELARRHPGPIEAAVIDVVLPRASCEDLAAALGRLRPGLRFVYISGYSREILRRHSGCAPPHFLQKPFTTDALARKLFEALSTPEPAEPASPAGMHLPPR